MPVEQMMGVPLYDVYRRVIVCGPIIGVGDPEPRRTAACRMEARQHHVRFMKAKWMVSHSGEFTIA